MTEGGLIVQVCYFLVLVCFFFLLFFLYFFVNVQVPLSLCDKSFGKLKLSVSHGKFSQSVNQHFQQLIN